MLARVLVSIVLAALAACAGATSHTRFADPDTLLAERDEWRGDKSGPVVLRLHVEALVDTRPDPANARSALVVHLVAAHFAAPAPIPVTFPVPRGAHLASSDVRLLAAAGAAVPESPARLVAPPAQRASTAADVDAVDPEQDLVQVTLPAPTADGVVEAILRFDVPGTFVADARRLGLVGLPVGELLLRYDLADDAVGTFQTTQPGAHPVVTPKEGRRLIALLVSKLPPVTARSPIARYVTLRASPKGYDQTFAADWTSATAAYRAGVIDASRALEGGFEVPYEPAGSGRAQVLDAYAWVRARPMRPLPADVRWDAARPLAEALQQNDLTAVDRAHLLHWILREAGIAHDFVMARAGSRPPLDPAFPAPGLFDAPLIHVPGAGGDAAPGGLILDPACDECAPGDVRASLGGGQALVIPVPPGTSEATFIPLTSPPTASTTP